MGKEGHEISLKVGELTDRTESGRGLVRMDSKSMSELGIREGDIVRLEGQKRTAAIAIRAYPADAGLSLIRMDGITRRNAGIGVGETIKIEKAEIKVAKRVVIAPAQKGMRLLVSPELMRKNLLMRPVMKGDIITPSPVVKRRERRSQSPFDDIFSSFGIDIDSFEDFSFTPIPSETKLVIGSTSPDGVVKITDETDIEINPEAMEVEDSAIPTMTYEDIGGLHPAIEKIREMVELPLRHPELFTRLGIDPPKGVLLYGPPGTGKTLLAKAVANESGASFFSIAGPEIISKWYGGSEENLRKIFENAEKSAPSIIFIDEIDAIAPKREQVTGEVERRVVSQLLSLMDGLKSRGKVIVIAATNRPNAIDQALRRGGRFDREIEIGVPDTRGRKEIFQIHTRNMPFSDDVNINSLANKTYGFVGADIEALVKEAAMSALRSNLPSISWKKTEELDPKMLEKLKVTKADFDNALKMVEPSAMREVMIEIPNVKWEDVGGLDEVKESLREMIEWPLKHPKSFERVGIRPPAGILLYGPPGCGKTMIAKAVATEAGANFMSVKGPECLTMWVGESERKIREIFKRAKQVAPSIIFFDEIDSLVPRRGMEFGSRVTENIVSQILTEMSGLEEMHNVVVIAASVTEDTPILIKDKSGNIKLLPIANFVDPYYKTGEEGIEKQIDGVQCLGFEARKNKKNNGLRFGKSAFKNVRGVFRHKVDEIYEIEYLGGKIRTTGNHSVFIRTNSGIQAKPVSMLNPGDFLVDLPYKVRSNNGVEIRNHMFDYRPSFEVPVFENDIGLESMHNFALSSNLPQTSIASEIGVAQTTASNWKRGICVPRKMSKNYFKHNFPENIALTPEFMRLFGYYAAEGYARKEVDFCFGENEKNLMDDLKAIINNAFGIEPDRIRHTTEGAVNLCYHSKPLAALLMKYCGKGAKNKHIPSFLFEAPREYFLEFLRAYVAGDGYVDKNGRIQITSVSQQLILEVNWLCRMHGIKSHISKFVAKEGRVINNGKPLKRTIAYRLGIGKHANPFIDKTSNAVSYTKRAVIKNIRKIPYNGYVYDLCGCENEAFFGGDSPILLHNTNRPDMLDSAILRPGRFDRQVLVPSPEDDARREIFKVHTKSMPLGKDVNLKSLAKDTEGYSGADIEAVVREAGLNALREDFSAKIVKKKHFDEALRKVRPSIDERVIDYYEKMMDRMRARASKQEKKNDTDYVG
ncbi:MAG: CDC48 family AAA ATPase [Candidatus Aenigmarchaeota archaeon]|nr:CDC48 family AAA ATPase [Candidatus Aenigmarchaeota archaeon]